MSLKKIFLWGSVFAFLLGGYLLLKQKEGARKTAEQRSRQIVSLPGDEIHSLTIFRKGEKLSINRVDDEWFITEPVVYKADQDRIDDLITNLTGEIERVVVQGEEAVLADFGLDPPQVRLNISSAEGVVETLAVGDFSPLMSFCYLQRGDSRETVLGPAALRRILLAPQTDFRDRTILSFSKNKISGFRLDIKDQNRKETIRAEKRDERWILTEPFDDRADGERIQRVIDNVLNGKISDFIIDSPAALVPYGLVEPFLKLTFSEDGEETSYVLLIGSSEKGKPNYYAKREGEGFVFSVPAEILKDARAGSLEFRDPHSITFERDKVAGINFMMHSKNLVLKKDGEKWVLPDRSDYPIDDWEIQSFYSALENLNAGTFRKEEDLKGEDYFSEITSGISLLGEEGEVLADLVIGLPDNTGYYFFVRTAQRPGVILGIRANEAKALAKYAEPFTFREKEILGFDRHRVQWITFDWKDESYRLEPAGEKWVLVQPQKRDLSEEDADNLLAAVNHVRAKDLITEVGDDLSPYGLDDPVLKVTVFEKDGSSPLSLTIGKQGENEVYAKVGEDKAIYLIDNRESMGIFAPLKPLASQ